ncbi:MAG TPA: hypothetical protein VHH73_20865, partial [Verrucomicrobiae bacterium]|nr:hypothetical protein [Verrucomicrobiae bacterium]
MKRLLPSIRSLVAIGAGWLFLFLLATAFDRGLWPANLLTIPLFRVVIATGAGYLTASLARRRELMHAMALGAIVGVSSLAAALAEAVDAFVNIFSDGISMAFDR